MHIARDFFRLGLAVALSVGSSVHDVGAQRATANATFDWFTYEGRDPIYTKVTAGPGEYLNPILTGFYPDPSIVRQGTTTTS